MEKFSLNYTKPAATWEDVLPLGNGSLGAMVWGNIAEETIGLNHDQVWSGYQRDRNNEGAIDYLDAVRQAILAKDFARADDIAERHMLGDFGENYLPLGNLKIKMAQIGETTNYSRQLDLNEALANVSFQLDGVVYKREYFTSFPQKALYIRLTGGRNDYTISFDSVITHQTTKHQSGLKISGQCPEHMDPDYIRQRPENFIQGDKGFQFEGEIKILETDGSYQLTDSTIELENASEVLIEVRFVDAKQPVINAYDEIKSEHIRDYQELFNRVDLSFGEQLALPTDERKQALKAGKADPGLFALYFQFGRYLLIASSRKGALPPNLQGIWAWQYPAAWSSNWTTNINIQMNYWAAEVTNLKECLDPYFEWLDNVVREGKRTAKTYYGARGSVVHHNVDRWYNTNPVGIEYGTQTGQKGCASFAMWPMALPWLSQELFKYYEYQQDEVFLRERVYPVLRETALFIVDWLQYVDGEYISYPSTSPENRFSVDGIESFAVTKNSAYDLQVIRELTENFNKTCEILAIEDSLLTALNEKVSKMTPVKVGSLGQILEWDEEYIELEVDHRHLSHLYGMFPGEMFDGNPELVEATKVSLDLRTREENLHPRTGWSNAWLINLYAVLEDKEKVGKYLKQLLNSTTLDNLWGMHPPLSAGGEDVFQVDANFGGTAGIANMLVNERNGQLNLLPGLPDFLPNGFVTGLRLKDNRAIDIEWEDGKLLTYSVYDV